MEKETAVAEAALPAVEASASAEELLRKEE